MQPHLFMHNAPCVARSKLENAKSKYNNAGKRHQGLRPCHNYAIRKTGCLHFALAAAEGRARAIDLSIHKKWRRCWQAGVPDKKR